MNLRWLMAGILLLLLGLALVVLGAQVARGHQSNDHSSIGVDVTIESALMIGGGHIRATGKYVCGPEDEALFGEWGVGFRVWEGDHRGSGRAERSGPLTRASCTGQWETWTLDSLAVYDGGITTPGSKLAYAKIQDALDPDDPRTHKHLGGFLTIPVTGTASPAPTGRRPCLEREEGRCIRR